MKITKVRAANGWVVKVLKVGSISTIWYVFIEHDDACKFIMDQLSANGGTVETQDGGA